MALLAACGPLSAQVVDGRVRSDAGEAVGDARVTLRPTEALAAAGVLPVRRITGPDGAFRIPVPAPGVYLLEVEALGWRSVGRFVNLDDGGEVGLEVRLRRDAIELEPLVVTASARPWWEVLQPPGLWPFYERMERYGRAGRGRYLTERDVAGWAGARLSTALNALIPWVSVQADPRLPGQVVLTGPGNCVPLVYLDGSLVNPRGGLGGGGRLRVDDIADPSIVAAVESYRGISDVPPDFTTIRPDVDWRCPVIAIWTRRR